MKHKNKIDIVIIGDSNTEGYGLCSMEQSYPYKLNSMLDDTNIHNMGVSGSCVINTIIDGKTVGMPYVGENKYTQALNINGDIFIINLGTNDAQDGTDDSLPIQDKYSNLIIHHHRFINDYKRILDDITQRYPNAKIVICIPIPVRKCIWPRHRQKYLEMLLPYFENILEEYSQLVCIDLQREFMQLDDDKIDSMYLDDGLHLNDKGTDFVADCMAPAIRKLIKNK